MNAPNYKSIQETEKDESDSNSTAESFRCENRFNRIPPKYTISICCAAWGFLTGVERAIIMPTLWLYFVKSFGSNAASTYYGITLSAFNLSVFIFAPVYGYLSFKGFRTKALLVVSNQLEVVGNIIYFVASEPWLVMLGRFIAGIGSGSEVPLYADLVRVTLPEERTPYIVILLLARQVGLIIGPAATLILSPVKFTIGSITLNIYNSPGFLMAILWCVQTVQVLISYPDIDKSGVILKTESEGRKINEMIMHKIYEKNTESDGSVHRNSDVVKDLEKPKLSWFENIKNILHKFSRYSDYNILSLLLIIFSSYFALIGLEAVLPPVSARFFHWTEIENSYVYLGAGIFVIIIYVILQSISRFYEDRLFVIIGLILLMMSYSWMSFTFGFINVKENVLYMTLVLLGIILHILGLSLVIACSESLFTKSIPAREMDMAQSVLRTTINFSLLIGPYIAGTLQMYPYLVFIILLLFICFSFQVFVLRYNLFEVLRISPFVH